MLEASESEEATKEAIHSAKLRGFRRHQQGYTVPLLVVHTRFIEQAIYDVIHENMLALNLSYFMFDLKRLSASLNIQLEHTLLAFMDAERRMARPAAQPS